MSKRKKSTKAAASEVAPAASAPVTLQQVADGYLAHLEQAGAGRGTLLSYGIELKLALRVLGPGTPLADLTEERVRAFFEGPEVTQTRTGEPKAAASVAKTRRVLRQALAWAREGGRAAR